MGIKNKISPQGDYFSGNLSDLLEYSNKVIKKNSKTFSFASRLFSRDVQMGVILLYSWCRFCDDKIDEAPSTNVAQERLQELRFWVNAAYNKNTSLPPNTPQEVYALQYVVQKYAIPQHYSLELLEGMAMDVAGTSYETLNDLLLYCYRVAGVVGLMMVHIIGVSSEKALLSAVNLGNAFQLTNISRDVFDDNKMERIYLPLQWLREEGVSPQNITDPKTRENVARVVRRLLAEADHLYASADQGYAYLSFWTGLGMAVARKIYWAIGKKVLEQGARAWNQRAYVPTFQKIILAAKAGLKFLLGTPKRIWQPWKKIQISLIVHHKP